MKKLLFFIPFLLMLISACHKEPNKIKEDPVLPPKVVYFDFRDSLKGTYQLTKDSTIKYTCTEWIGPPQAPFVSCAKKGFIKDYTKNSNIAVTISYDDSSEDVFSGTAPISVSASISSQPFKATQSTKSISSDNSNYYTTIFYTYKIKKDSIFYTHYESSKKELDYFITYYSGIKIK